MSVSIAAKLLLGGVAAAMLIGAGAGGSSANASPAKPGESNLLIPKVLDRLSTHRVKGMGRFDPESGLIVYQFSVNGDGPTGKESAIAHLKSGGWVFTDMSIIGEQDYFLGFGSVGAEPAGSWRRLATKSDMGTLEKYGADVAPPAPGKPVPTSTGTAESMTGIPDVDKVIRSPDTTPAQLWALADALEQQGKRREAEIVRKRGDELYSSLRIKHTANGGTPFKVEEGLFPSNVAKHYGGSLEELRKVNVGRDIITLNKDWRLGQVFKLPLSWDAERKVPPTPVRGSSSAAAAAKAAAAKASGGGSTVSPQQSPPPYPTGGNGPLTNAAYNAGANARARGGNNA